MDELRRVSNAGAEALADQINRTGWNNSRLRVSPIEQAA
jgi:hypothetical protein